MLTPFGSSPASDPAEIIIDTFQPEINIALHRYSQYVMELGNDLEEPKQTLQRLIAKAIKNFVGRGNGARHCLATEGNLTAILSERSDTNRPLCGIYFNLYSPFDELNKLKVPPKAQIMQTELSENHFEHEVSLANKKFEKVIVSLKMTADEFESSSSILMSKAIAAFQKRGPTHSHGISLNHEVTYIISKAEGNNPPFCSIYFNLHSPYNR